MSCNFYLYLDGDAFPAEAWLDVISPLGGRRLEARQQDSYFVDEWICGDEKESVWVALRPAERISSAPPWARWVISVDFHASVFGEVYYANAVLLFGLHRLPVRVPGVRVGALDGMDVDSVLHETVDAWAERATGWLLRETVDALVGLVRETD